MSGSVLFASTSSSRPELEFTHNTCDSNHRGGNGGAVFVSLNTEVLIAHNTFTRNIAGGNGGAVYYQAQDVGMYNNSFVNNHADGAGGALAVYFTGSAQVDMVSINNLFANNSANRGGAIYSSGRKLRVINNTIVNNIDTTQAGGLVLTPSFGREAVVINSILWGNRSINTFNEQFSTNQSFNTFFYNNDVEGGVGGVGGSGNFDSNPLFMAASGFVGSHLNGLNANWTVDSCLSPVIDTGNRDTILVSDYQEFDLAGNLRNTRATIDVGAYETFGTSNEGAWTSSNICGADSTFSIWAWHPRGIAPNSTIVQADTGTGWFTVNNGLFPQVNISNDTIFFTNAPLDFTQAPGRVINVYSCFSDTTPAWNPDTFSTTYDSIDVFGCEGDTFMLGSGGQTTSGFYTDVLVNRKGCDSILTSELILYPAPFVDVYDTICPGESFDWNGQAYTSTGSYENFRTLFYNGAQCDSSTTLNLIVLSNLAPAASDTTVACLNQQLTFDITDPDITDYSWSDGSNTGTGPTFSITPTTFFQRVFVTVTDINDCEYSLTRDFLEFEFESFATQTDQSNDPFVNFSFIVGPPSNADDLYWSFGDGDTSHLATVNHEYTSNGNFDWCMVLEGMCGMDSTCSSISIGRVGKEELNELQWKIYPNPVQSQLMISTGDETIELVQIYDMNGRLVGSKRGQTPSLTLELGLLPKASYSLLIRTNQRTISTLLQKE